MFMNSESGRLSGDGCIVATNQNRIAAVDKSKVLFTTRTCCGRYFEFVKPPPGFLNAICFYSTVLNNNKCITTRMCQ